MGPGFFSLEFATDGCSSDLRCEPADSAIRAGALPNEKDGADSRPPRTCDPNMDFVPRPRDAPVVCAVRGRNDALEMAEPPREPRVSGVCARGGADRGKVGSEAEALSKRCFTPLSGRSLAVLSIFTLVHEQGNETTRLRGERRLQKPKNLRNTRSAPAPARPLPSLCTHGNNCGLHTPFSWQLAPQAEARCRKRRRRSVPCRSAREQTRRDAPHEGPHRSTCP